MFKITQSQKHGNFDIALELELIFFLAEINEFGFDGFHTHVSRFGHGGLAGKGEWKRIFFDKEAWFSREVDMPLGNVQNDLLIGEIKFQGCFFRLKMDGFLVGRRVPKRGDE